MHLDWTLLSWKLSGIPWFYSKYLKNCHTVGLCSNLKSQPHSGCVNWPEMDTTGAWQEGWIFWGAERSSASPPQPVPQPQMFCVWISTWYIWYFPRFAARLIEGILDFKAMIDKWVSDPPDSLVCSLLLQRGWA